MFLRRVAFFALLSALTVAVLGYGTYKALPIFLGPKIEVSEPKNGEEVTGTTVYVTGTVSRTKALYINKIPTAFNEAGVFSTRLAIYPGNNILQIEAVDRFGRSKVQNILVGTR
jgi:hypothetical protein